MGLKMAYKKIQTRYNANIKTKNDVFKTIRFYNFTFKKPYFICNFNCTKNSKKHPLHPCVEMMGLIGMGNNPMVGATVAVAVAVEEASK